MIIISAQDAVPAGDALRGGAALADRLEHAGETAIVARRLGRRSRLQSRSHRGPKPGRVEMGRGPPGKGDPQAGFGRGPGLRVAPQHDPIRSPAPRADRAGNDPLNYDASPAG